MDSRHEDRIRTVQNLFAHSFKTPHTPLPYQDDPRTDEILKNIDKIDKYITESATKYPIDKIAKTDLAILRLAIYELVVEVKNPPKVVIDEAVELAKELGGDHSYSFVNGVLGSVMKTLNPKS